MTKITQAYADDASCIRLEIEGSDDWYVFADTPEGNVYVLNHIFDDEAQAERLVAKIQAAGKINLDHWTHLRTIYGSQAFQEEEAEACLWADAIRAGHASEDDVPGSLRELL